MGQEMAARGGGGDPFADARIQSMHREISLLRAANGAAKVGAGLIRQQRLQLLEDEVARQEKRAKKRNKEAKAAIELANPATHTVTAATQHAALLALQKANQADYRVNQAQSDVDRAHSDGETWRMVDGAASLADELGVADGYDGGMGGGMGPALAAGAVGVGLGMLGSGNRDPRRHR